MLECKLYTFPLERHHPVMQGLLPWVRLDLELAVPAGWVGPQLSGAANSSIIVCLCGGVKIAFVEAYLGLGRLKVS